MLAVSQNREHSQGCKSSRLLVKLIPNNVAENQHHPWITEILTTDHKLDVIRMYKCVEYSLKTLFTNYNIQTIYDNAE